MVGSIAKLYLYSKAPKTTFAVRHPVRTARMAKTKWDLRHAYAPRIAAAGAAALALPVGYLLGKVMRRSPGPEA